MCPATGVPQAKKEQLTLEQRLRLESRERHKAVQLITTAEERATNELKDIQVRLRSSLCSSYQQP